MKFDIADRIRKGAALEDCTVECSAAVWERLRISLHGKIDAPRSGYRVVIHEPDFAGNLRLFLGPGSGVIEIAARGPVNADIKLWRDAQVFIGEGTTINGARIIADNSDIHIGNDNLWSDEIILQSNDQHGIIDLETMKLNNAHRRRVEVGDHAWIGRRAMIMPDVRVGSGSILAAGAVLTGDMEENCVYAGVPARLIRRNTSWSRGAEGPSPQERRFLERNRQKD